MRQVYEYRYNAANQITRVRLYAQGQSQPTYPHNYAALAFLLSPCHS
jgi:hypothetical protein